MPPPVGKGDWELFNLREDPAEMIDLATKNPEKLKNLVAQREQYQKDNGVLDISVDLSGAVNSAAGDKQFRVGRTSPWQ